MAQLLVTLTVVWAIDLQARAHHADMATVVFSVAILLSNRMYVS